MPAQVVPGGFSEDALVFAQLGEDLGGFRAEGGLIFEQEINQRANGNEAVGWGKPLWTGKMAGPFRIAGALFEKEGHGILVGGEKLEERLHFQAVGQALEGILVSGQGVAIDEDIELGVLTFDHNVKTGSHLGQCIGERAAWATKMGRASDKLRGRHLYHFRHIAEGLKEELDTTKALL